MGDNLRNFTDAVFTNWPWSKSDFLGFQNYLLNQFKNRFLAQYNKGVLTGGVVTAGGGMSVDVTLCSGVSGDGLLIDAPTTNSLAIATADGANPRIDLVIAQVVVVATNNLANPNTAVSGDTELEEQSSISVITGTPAGSPTAPTGSVPANAIILAKITVAAGVGSISAGAIDMTAASAGGLRNVASFQGESVSPADDLLVGRLVWVSNTSVKIGVGIGGTVEFTVNGVQYSSPTDLTFDMGSDLVGGESASTAYYLYLSAPGGVITKKIRAEAPLFSSGKIGYHPTETDERCVGCIWNNASSNLAPFSNANGLTRLSGAGNYVALSTGSSPSGAWSSEKPLDMPDACPLAIGTHYFDGRRMAGIIGAGDATGAIPATPTPNPTSWPSARESEIASQDSDTYTEITREFLLRISDQAAPSLRDAIFDLHSGGSGADVSNHGAWIHGWHDPWSPQA